MARKGARGRGWFYNALDDLKEHEKVLAIREKWKPSPAVEGRTQAFMDIKQEDNVVGRIVFELRVSLSIVSLCKVNM